MFKTRTLNLPDEFPGTSPEPNKEFPDEAVSVQDSELVLIKENSQESFARRPENAVERAETKTEAVGNAMLFTIPLDAVVIIPFVI